MPVDWQRLDRQLVHRQYRHLLSARSRAPCRGLAELYQAARLCGRVAAPPPSPRETPQELALRV